MATQAAGKRPLGALGRMSFVAAMHAALLVVLARSFGIAPPALFDGSDLVQVQDTATIDPVELPPPAGPVMSNPQVHLTPPVDPVPMDDTVDIPTPLTVGPGPQIVEGSGSGVPMPVIQNVRVDPRRPLSLPVYSASYIRQGIEGSVEVEIQVLPDGRVGDARVIRSSGFEQMDLATLDEAKRRWRLIPATRDGVAFAQWYRLRVKFELR